jgi:hypothetical protein
VTRLRPTLAAIATTALVAIGCGGDSGQSKEDFIAEADEVCAELDVRSKALTESQPETPEDIVAFGDEAAAFVRDGIEQLDAIELPADEEDREGAAAYVDALREAEPVVGQLRTAAQETADAVEAEDQEAAQAAVAQLQAASAQLAQSGERAKQAAQGYGFEQCGSEGDAAPEGGAEPAPDPGTTTE